MVPATWLAWLRGRGGRALGVLAFALLGAWTWALATGALPFPDTRLLYGTSSYPGMGMAPLQGALSRAALVACGLLLTAAAWSLSPGRTGWLTRFGAASLWPYVLHGLLLRAVPLQSGLLGLVPLFQLPAAALAGLAAVILPAARTLGGSSPPSDRAR